MKEAIILAGGFGTRLKDVVSDVPKPMAPINDTPFLVYLLQKLKIASFQHIILSTGYLHEKIESFFGNSYDGIDISYTVEEVPLGTGGAIKKALSKTRSENIVVLNGDTLFDIDFQSLENLHLQKKAFLTIALREVDDVSRYGEVKLDADRIISFGEKSENQHKGMINGGIYLINKTDFSEIALPDKFSFEKDFIEQYYDEKEFFGKIFQSYFIDIGIPSDYQRAQIEFPTLFKS